MRKKVIVIVNPAATKGVPLLVLLGEVFRKQKIEWELFLTKKKNHAIELAKEAVTKNPDAVAVYGGDGMVAEVAAGMYESKIPLIILPGGTANVLAKELGVASDLETALKVFRKRPKKVKLDVSLINKARPMFIRVEVGVVAKMVLGTARETKDALGQLAYPVNALKEFSKAKSVIYTLTIDGVKRQIKGIGLMIANVGNIGIPGVSFQQNIKSADGKLNVFVLQSKDLASLIALGSSTILGTQKPAALKHWRGKVIRVHLPQTQTVMSDDKLIKTTDFEVSLQKTQLLVLT